MYSMVILLHLSTFYPLPEMYVFAKCLKYKNIGGKVGKAHFTLKQGGWVKST